MLTPRGRALWPVLISIWEWERHWVPDHADELPAMHHTTCDADFAPVLTCAGVRGVGDREGRCRAVGSERFLAAVDARRVDATPVGLRYGARPGRACSRRP